MKNSPPCNSCPPWQPSQRQVAKRLDQSSWHSGKSGQVSGFVQGQGLTLQVKPKEMQAMGDEQGWSLGTKLCLLCPAVYPPAGGGCWMCWPAGYALFEPNIKSVVKEKRDVTHTGWSPNQADGLRMDSCSGTRPKDDPDTRVGHRGLGIKHQCSGQEAEAQRRGTSTFQELAQGTLFLWFLREKMKGEQVRACDRQR